MDERTERELRLKTGEAFLEDRLAAEPVLRHPRPKSVELDPKLKEWKPLMRRKDYRESRAFVIMAALCSAFSIAAFIAKDLARREIVIPWEKLLSYLPW